MESHLPYTMRQALRRVRTIKSIVFCLISVVTAEMPGVGKDDIDLTVRENTLIISGKRNPSTDDEDAAWHRRERPHGEFSRSVRLPLRVDPDKVEARAKNGVLEIEMGRPDAERPRKIKVKAS